MRYSISVREIENSFNFVANRSVSSILIEYWYEFSPEGGVFQAFGDRYVVNNLYN